MKIHAIQTGTARIKTAMQRGRGRGIMRQINMLRDRAWTEPLPIYAWAIEHPEGVVIVDTGELASTPDPSFARFDVQPEDEIGPQLRKLGIAPDDVRTVILTHLHGDHMNGLRYFPKSAILVNAIEYRNARRLSGRLIRWIGKQAWPDRFAPAAIIFEPISYGPFTHSYPVTSSGDVVIVPSPGHTRGHMSVIVAGAELSYFLAGDATYTEQLLLEQQVDGVGSDPAAAVRTMQTILRYAEDHPTVYLPAHDPASAQRLETRATLGAPRPERRAGLGLSAA